jgi:hypothetical protein
MASWRRTLAFLALSVSLPHGPFCAFAADCNGNGIADQKDIAAGTSKDCNRNGIPDECEGRPLFHRGDADGNGAVNVTDAVVILAHLFAGGPAPGCLETADVDNDGSMSVTDAIDLLGFLFLRGAAPAEPGPRPAPCGADPDAPGSAGDLGCALYEGCVSPQ